MDAPPGIAPWIYVDLFKAWEAGDMETATARQEETFDVVQLCRMFGSAAHNVKTVFSERLGIDCGKPLPPLNTLNDEEQAQVRQVARDLGLTKSRVAV